MIDTSTHTRKIWRSHFDGADSTYTKQKKKETGLVYNSTDKAEVRFSTPSLPTENK
jgi:hypothetical protein